MTAKEFLEDFDPQIKEVGHEAHTYTVEQVITRMEAYLKNKVDSGLPDIQIGNKVMTTGIKSSHGDYFSKGDIGIVENIHKGIYCVYFPAPIDMSFDDVEPQEIRKI